MSSGALTAVQQRPQLLQLLLSKPRADALIEDAEHGEGVPLQCGVVDGQT